MWCTVYVSVYSCYLYPAGIQTTRCEHVLVMPQRHTSRSSQQGSVGFCWPEQTLRQRPPARGTSRAICCLTWPDLWHADMCWVKLSGGMVSGWGSVTELPPWSTSWSGCVAFLEILLSFGWFHVENVLRNKNSVKLLKCFRDKKPNCLSSNNKLT